MNRIAVAQELVKLARELVAERREVQVLKPERGGILLVESIEGKPTRQAITTSSHGTGEILVDLADHWIWKENQGEIKGKKLEDVMKGIGADLKNWTRDSLHPDELSWKITKVNRVSPSER